MKNEVGKKIIDILIEHEGRNKRIAFLPYKVEMWDSFKSVYTEAKRARLNAKICPIQYSTLQYGNKCVSQYDDWRDFRRSPNLIHTLDEFDPEIVITHYPFDYQNSVTTIDNRYYSAELKKQGRTLVYIPYHGATILPAETRLPIMRNVDYIFAANSSNIEMFPKSAKTFVVGSTKKDLIHYTGYSNDVLIINSIAPFIRDKFRIQKYIKIIEENKGSNIIFRPHPLIVDAIQTLQSGRYYEYMWFLETAQNKGVKIDTSKNVYSIINRSKKIYCDPASISMICQSAHVKVNII